MPFLEKIILCLDFTVHNNWAPDCSKECWRHWQHTPRISKSHPTGSTYLSYLFSNHIETGCFWFPFEITFVYVHDTLWCLTTKLSTITDVGVSGGPITLEIPGRWSPVSPILGPTLLVSSFNPFNGHWWILPKNIL